ncbi:MAG: hemerythrin domain-containing protein [Rhodocyclales bacterium]|nr:hemerythrin domain-containing protein [Rhodocyclales bacterium]
MDGAHREFVGLCGSLLAAADGAGFLSALDCLISHTAAHFEQEDCWMADCGFAPIRIHMMEHRRVLDLLRATRERVVAGDLAAGRRVAGGLPDWFYGHAATLDAALARHIKATGYDPDAATGSALPQV